MIDRSWVHSLADHWGHWMRKAEAKQGQIQGTLGRINEEGPEGAAIKSHGAKIPIVDFPEEIAAFHRVWLSLTDRHQMIIWIDYKQRGSVKQKFKKMDMKKDAYYRLRSAALIAVVSGLPPVK